ncbi:MAG: Killer protein [Legionellaceae bacterium]|nr:Killer protein [Legionellaceae bacterium]
MIRNFKHKGLKLFYEKGKMNGIQARHKNRLRMQLVALNTAQSIEDVDIPGYKLHQLKGSKKSLWAISVNKNWRLTFEFIDGDVFVLNYEDYH